MFLVFADKKLCHRFKCCHSISVTYLVGSIEGVVELLELREEELSFEAAKFELTMRNNFLLWHQANKF